MASVRVLRGILPPEALSVHFQEAQPQKNGALERKNPKTDISWQT